MSPISAFLDIALNGTRGLMNLWSMDLKRLWTDLLWLMAGTAILAGLLLTALGFLLWGGYHFLAAYLSLPAAALIISAAALLLAAPVALLIKKRKGGKRCQ